MRGDGVPAALPVARRLRAVRGGRAAAPVRAVRGFTLLELLAVIVLLALAMTLAGFALSRSLADARVAAAGSDLAAALRWTRSRAIASGRSTALELDLANARYRAADQAPVSLPTGMQIALTTAASERIDSARARIRFFPDGSSTGGHIVLTHGGHRWRIDVAWLTGSVSMRESAG